MRALQETGGGPFRTSSVSSPYPRKSGPARRISKLGEDTDEENNNPVNYPYQDLDAIAWALFPALQYWGGKVKWAPAYDHQRSPSPPLPSSGKRISQKQKLVGSNLGSLNPVLDNPPYTDDYHESLRGRDLLEYPSVVCDGSDTRGRY